MNYLIHNGKMRKEGIPLISPDNRSFRYGDGFFETMRMIDRKIMLEDLHMERLFHSLRLLRFDAPRTFTPARVREMIAELAAKNQHLSLARVRVTIFRGEGGLFETGDCYPHHIIQTWPLNASTQQLNENGLILGIYKEARKACDTFSHIKSNNYLPYAMAAMWAKEQKLNDALLLNSFDRIADATIANLFIVKDGVIKTPAVSEGCVGGIMRRHLLQVLRKEDMPVEEIALSAEDVLQASEVFVTNAISGIKWVKQVNESEYPCQLAAVLHRKIMDTRL